MLRAIIFDLDGVVADSHPAHKQAWSELLSSLGRTISPEQLEYVVEGRKRDEILRHFVGALSEEHIREYGRRKDSLFKKYSSDLKLVPGVREFIQEAHSANIAIGLASSAGRNRVESNLRQLGIADYFQVAITGDDVVQGKPDPALFIKAAEGLNIPREGVLVCEDAVNGVHAAKAAGMRCLGIASPGREVALEAAGADTIVRDFRNVSLRDLAVLFEPHSRSYTATAQ